METFEGILDELFTKFSKILSKTTENLREGVRKSYFFENTKICKHF